MFDFLYEISTVWLAIYCVVFAILVMWFGIIFVGPLLRVLIGREPGINDLVFYTTSGFSLFYGLLLGLLAVAAYQNLEQVRQNVFGEASSLASLYRDASLYPEPVGSEFRDLLKDYTLYVIYKDWPAHRKGKIYNGGTNRLMMIEYTILKLHPRSPSQEILQSQTLQVFGELPIHELQVCLACAAFGLHEVGEAVADAPGGAAIEAEDELVEISRKVFRADGAVVGAEQPALGEAEHQVDGGQAQRRVAPGSARLTGWWR